VGPTTGLDDVEKGKFLILPGLELRLLCRPACSQSLYRLSYPGTDLWQDLLYLLQCQLISFVNDLWWNHVDFKGEKNVGT
jgi:hypothetical protein